MQIFGRISLVHLRLLMRTSAEVASDVALGRCYNLYGGYFFYLRINSVLIRGTPDLVQKQGYRNVQRILTET